MNLQDLNDRIAALLKAGVPSTTPVTIFVRDKLNEFDTLIEASGDQSDYLISGLYLADPSPKLCAPFQETGLTFALVPCDEDICDLLNTGTHTFECTDELHPSGKASV